jgi:hypothetical protein
VKSPLPTAKARLRRTYLRARYGGAVTPKPPDQGDPPTRYDRSYRRQAQQVEAP